MSTDNNTKRTKVDLQEEAQVQPFNCGQCNAGFKTHAQFLKHDCVVRGCKPTEPQFMGDNWEAIGQGAIARGSARRIQELEKELNEPQEDTLQAKKEVSNRRNEIKRHRKLIEDADRFTVIS